MSLRVILNNAAGTGPGSPVQIFPVALPAATVGTAYTQSLTTTGGLPPFIWSITAGSLPSGLTLNSSTGILSGVPSGSSGNFAFTVLVSANTQFSIQGYTLVVNPAVGGSSVFSPLPSTLGWSQIPGTNMSAGGFSVCPGGSDNGCSAIMPAWSGGMAYQNKNMLLIPFGGGHTDYNGNEIYALDFRHCTGGTCNGSNWAPQFLRLTPSHTSSCTETANSGTEPASRHTYNGVWLNQTAGTVGVFGGAPACNTGIPSSGLWTVDLSTLDPSCAPNCTLNATRRDLTMTVAGGSFRQSDEPASGYDFVSDVSWLSNTYNSDFGNYDSKTNTFTCTRCGHSDGLVAGMTGEVDDYNRFFLVAGGGNMQYYDLRNPANAPVDISGLANCGPFVSASFPGLTFNSNRKKLWGYPGSGNTVYEIDLGPATKTCTPISFGSVAGTDFPLPAGTGTTSNGIFGRFRYFWLDDVAIYVPDALHNGWIFRADAAQPSDTNSFATRVASAGVTFSNDLSNVTQVTSGNGYYIGSDTAHPTQQSPITPTGSGFSAMFTVVGKTSAGASGFFREALNTACGQRGVHEHCDVYVQYRYRVDKGFRTNLGDVSDGTTMKWDIMHNQGVTCASIGDAEYTTQIWQGLGQSHGIPITYSGCGSDGAGTWPAVPNQTWVGFSPPYFLQQGDTASTGYNCSHETGGFDTNPLCFKVQPNTWYTVMKHIHIGDLTTNGPTGRCNTTSANPLDHCYTEMWIAPAGGNMVQLMNVWDFHMTDDMNPYDTIDLLPYATGKNPALDHAPVRVWYKDLIAGTQPILPPTGPTPGQGQHP